LFCISFKCILPWWLQILHLFSADIWFCDELL
jgi:hypothetical protein